MKQSHSIDIQAPPDKVFYWLDDSQRVMEWIEGVVVNEDIEITDDRVGSTFRQVFEEKGRPMEFHGVVTGYEKDRRLAISMTSAFGSIEVDYLLEPKASGTTLTQNSSFDFKGIWRVMGWVMGPSMKKAGTRKVNDDFARLKALCEA